MAFAGMFTGFPCSQTLGPASISTTPKFRLYSGSAAGESTSQNDCALIQMVDEAV
jgi:hypothetical protein